MGEELVTDGASRRVVRWTRYDEDFPAAWDIGTCGGFFDSGMRWADYIETFEAGLRPYHEALRRAVLARGLREGGFWHQENPQGIPVFDDGGVAQFSMRAWGDLLAAVWASEEDRDYAYTDFAWDGCDAPPEVLEGHPSRDPTPTISPPAAGADKPSD